MNWTEHLDKILDDIQASILSFLIKLGPFAVALMPSLFTGYAVYGIFKSEGRLLAILFAVIIALAVETVGIVSTHTAIELYNAWQLKQADWVKLALMVGLVPVYIICVSGTILYADEAFNDLVQALGVASPFLTCIVYIAVALARDLHRIKQQAKVKNELENKKELADLDWQREKERLEIELKHQEKLARIEAKSKRNVSHENIESKSVEAISPDEREIIARNKIQENPDISGAQLGRELGLSARMGQIIKKDIVETNGWH